MKKTAMGGDSEGAMEPRQTERENAVEAGTAAPRLSEKEVRRGVKDHVRKWNGVLNEDNIETVGDAMRWVYGMVGETRRQYSRETGHKMGLDYSRLLDKDDSRGRKIDTEKAKESLKHVEAMAERMKERLESAIAKTNSDAPRRALEETLAELERTVKWYRRAANGDVTILDEERPRMLRVGRDGRWMKDGTREVISPEEVVREMEEKLGGMKVHVETEESVPEEVRWRLLAGEDVKGWYDEVDGTVHLYGPGIESDDAR